MKHTGKHRFIAMLAALIMTAVYMPALTFAEDELISYEASYGSVSIPEICIEDDQNEGKILYRSVLKPETGDKVKVNKKDTIIVYAWNGSSFVNESDSNDILGAGFCYIESNGRVQITFGHGGGDNWVATCYLDKDQYKLTNTVSGISFTPSNITVQADSAYVENWGKEKYTGYVIYGRNGSPDSGFFAKGDKLTVKYTSGETRVFEYVGDNRFIWNDLELANGPSLCGFKLDSGNNEIDIEYHGVRTTINVLLEGDKKKEPVPDSDTSDDADAKKKAEEAAAAAAAKAEVDRLDALEWNGTASGAVPAAKSVKVKGAKKKVTVSWTRPAKKKLKKFDKVEIQVCPDREFARANTKRVEVKKSKNSCNVKGLAKKTTYYVRVRDVKGSGTAKAVSKWSKVKKVKTAK